MNKISLSLMAIAFSLIINGEGQAKVFMSCIKEPDVSKCGAKCKADDLNKPSITKNDPNCKAWGGSYIHGCYCDQE